MGTVILFGIKQAIKIIMGVALTFSIFFGVSWLVDWNATRNARMPDSPKFWPYADRLERRDIEKHQILPPPPPSSSEGKSFPRPVQPRNAQDEHLVAMPRKTGEHAAIAPLPPLITYTIQLGSFQNAEVAQAFSDSLVAKGYPAYVLQTDVAGKGTVYRVRIGKFTTMEEAQALAIEIEKKENLSAFITSK